MNYKDFHSELFTEASGDAAKAFEDDIVTLALLSTEFKEISLEKLYDDNTDKFLAPAKRDETISSVGHLNKEFGKIWKEGHNANFASKASPTYGFASAKADIVMNGNLPISVKLDGGYVVVSSGNKEEFAGIFMSALDYFLETNNVDVSVEKEVNDLKKAIKVTADELIGVIKRRHLSPSELKKKALSKSDTEEARVFFSKMDEEIERIQSNIIDEYDKTNREIKEKYIKEVSDLLKKNPKLKQYVVWEGLTASLKYDYQMPYATHVLSPKGIYDISSPDKPFVKACAKASKFNVRGLPMGAPRSIGRGGYFKKVAKKVTGGEIVDVEEILQDLNQMAYNLKFDVTSKRVAKELEKLSKLDESTLNEISIKQIFSSVKRGLDSIRKRVASSIRDFGKKVFDKIKKLKKVSIIDIIASGTVDVDGEIKIPDSLL